MDANALWLCDLGLSIILILSLQINYWQWRRARRKRRQMRGHIEGVSMLAHGMDRLNREW